MFFHFLLFVLVVLWDVSNHPTEGGVYEGVDSLEIQATFFLVW
mgnify:CR=1 FL=1